MNIRFKTPFTGQEGRQGTQEAALIRTQAYQAAYPQRQAAFFFSAHAISLLLAPEEAAGIRFYFAEPTPIRQALVAVATSKTGKDLSTGLIALDTTPEGAYQPLADLTHGPAVNRNAVERITKAQAAVGTTAHRAALPGTTHGAFWGRDFLLAALQRDNAAGLCFYPCLDEQGQLSLLFIPLADEQSRVPVNSSLWTWILTGTDPERCPHNCDDNIFGFSLAHLSLPAAQHLRVQRMQQRGVAVPNK